MSKAKNLIHKWHEVIESDDLKMLEDIIADNAVFSSPVVFKPMEGKISNFKVMIRPFKAVQKVQEKMIEALESLS